MTDLKLPNKCPVCSLTEEADTPDPKNAQEVVMHAGPKKFTALYDNTPCYMPGEHGPSRIRVVICANCGCVYAKGV